MVALFGSRPMAARAVTDLPDPDSPTMPSTSPGAMEKSMPRTAWTVPAFVRNSTSSPSTCSAGSGT